jgi:DNA-binding NarL/FixJ family response regulator
MTGIRVVVVSERRLSTLALAGVLGSIPETRIVAEVDQVGAAKCYCERGEADVLIVDASVIVREETASEQVGPAERVPGAPAVPMAESLRNLRSEWVLHGPQLDTLTPRELEVFALLGAGLSNRHIGKQLGVTERTVKSHVGRVLTKLNLESRLQAGLAAFVHGLSDESSRELASSVQ